jgi:hypothetical protein
MSVALRQIWIVPAILELGWQQISMELVYKMGSTVELVEIVLYAMGPTVRSDWMAFETTCLLNIISESWLRVQSAEKLKSGSVLK